MAKDIATRIGALTFHGCGDEGVELFRRTCALCYAMNGIGDHGDKVETLYLWAKEMADESKAWCEENDPEAMEDTEQGHWGHL